MCIRDSPDRPELVRESSRWRFDLAAPEDQNAYECVRRAVIFLDRHAEEVTVPSHPAARAMAAIEMSGLFEADEGDEEALLDRIGEAVGRPSSSS